MIHHDSVGTNDVARAKSFYDAVLPVVGITPMSHSDRSADYGSGDFLFSVETPVDGQPATVGNGSHVAFAAHDRGMVDRFYKMALANGGASDGEPGLRPEYYAHYYGAFVCDPDGNKIEAVIYSAK